MNIPNFGISQLHNRLCYFFTYRIFLAGLRLLIDSKRMNGSTCFARCNPQTDF